MKRRTLRSMRALCLLLALAVPLSAGAFALSPAPQTDAAHHAGTFSYVLGSEYDLTDTFLFSDRWFDGDAAVENAHLRTVSLIAAMASGASNEHPDPDRGAGIVSFLTDAGFSDVEVNRYYTVTPGTDSAGCCIGHKQLGDCTLLAVIPRSQGYGAEWSGNFNVGTSGLHRGFKAARDEVLRFAGQYVADHGIEGRLKVWIAGHSRGAAIANLTAGFLVEYPEWLGELDEHGIYAYTFGTPAGVFSGLTQGDVGTVDAAPEANATPGGGCTLALDETAAVDLSDAKYDCIRNYYTDADFTPMLMPAVWGATRYGRDTLINAAWASTAGLAMRYTEELDPRIREETEFGDPSVGFAAKMLSTDGGFALVDDPSSDLNIRDFVSSRIAMIADGAAYSREVYVSEGYEALLRPLFAAVFGYGSSIDSVVSGLLSDPDAAADALFAVLSIYLAYAYSKAERLDAAAGETAPGTNVSAINGMCSTFSLALAFAPDMVREKLTGLIGENAAVSAILDSALADAAPFFAAANILSPAEGVSCGDAMLDVAAGYVQPVLASLVPDADAADARLAAQLLGNLFFGNDGDTFRLPLTLTITLFPTPGADAAVDLATDELRTAATLLGNIAPMGREHINAAELGWMRANDTAYVLAAFTDEPDGSARLFLTGAEGAELYYTVNGLASAAANGVYGPDGILLPNIGFLMNYTVSVSARDGSVMNPVWQFSRVVGQDPLPEYPPYDPAPEAEPEPFFEDVPADAYFAEAVRWAALNGITNGITDTAFGPYGFCTRGQIAALLWRAAGCPAAEPDGAFADVSPDAYYAEAVAWAAESGITDGTSETTFSPEDCCTCAQILTLVWRAAGCPAPESAPRSDLYYAQAEAWAFESGAAKDAYDPLTFDLAAFCFRADAVTLMYRTAAQAQTR